MTLIQRLVKKPQNQYLIPDSLTHSGGVITAIINGVSYTATLSGLTANTLYFLYLRSGVTNLQFNTTVPSSYRATYSDAILIGAFYSNGLTPIGFGSFVNIEGVPKSNLFQAGPSRFYINGTLLNSGDKGVVTIDDTRIYRDGSMMYFEFRMQKDSTGNSSLSGNYQIAPPLSNTTEYQIDENSIAFGAAWLNFIRVVGTGWWGNSGIAYDVLVNYVNNNKLEMAKADGTNTVMTTTTVNFTGYANHYYGITAKFPIVGWSNTPLKDL